MLGRRQVVRHQPLELAIPGSNPGAPDICLDLGLRVMATTTPIEIESCVHAESLKPDVCLDFGLRVTAPTTRFGRVRETDDL